MAGRSGENGVGSGVGGPPTWRPENAVGNYRVHRLKWIVFTGGLRW
ncbi:hypothetical protein HMPREF1979_03223 [Actinomyces johnsonii F0542]|uniref:Uncharacterized protein n=1 Tax=Actinomyces johnsonii F0542 TaxID=1321818 RepID=U1PZ66_9ACTO|nr:hypothetical protein HMPREF1979_03223 [Actinomyces johnsonii F0542]